MVAKKSGTKRLQVPKNTEWEGLDKVADLLEFARRERGPIYHQINNEWRSSVIGESPAAFSKARNANKDQFVEVLAASYLEVIRQAALKFAAANSKATLILDAVTKNVAKKNSPVSDLGEIIVDNPIDALTLLIILEKTVRNEASLRQVKLALKRHEGTPERIAKIGVKACWGELSAEIRQTRYKAAFARKMLDEFKSLSNQAVIERWCREWEKDGAQKP